MISPKTRQRLRNIEHCSNLLEIRNPDTNKCVDINTKEGKMILEKYFTKESFLDNFYRKLIIHSKWTEKWDGYWENSIMGMLWLLDKHDKTCFVIGNDPSFNTRETLRWENEEDKHWLYIPVDFKKHLNICIKKKIRFVIIPLTLIQAEILSKNGKKNYNVHSNFLILDKKMKTVDHFEPNGVSVYIRDMFETDILEDMLRGFFSDLNIDNTGGYYYLPPSKICPLIGPQAYEAMVPVIDNIDSDGYCLAWSLMYADLRLTFPDRDPLELQESMLETVTSNPNLLRQTIRNYSSYLLTNIQMYKTKFGVRGHEGEKNKKKLMEFIIQRLYSSVNYVTTDKENLHAKKKRKEGYEWDYRVKKWRKKCKRRQVRNPKTNRCVNIPGDPWGKFNSRFEKLEKEWDKSGKIGKQILGKRKSPKICRPNKILNSKTNRCVNKSGKIGKQILGKRKSPKICRPNKILNSKTNRCVNKSGKIGKQILGEKIGDK